MKVSPTTLFDHKSGYNVPVVTCNDYMKPQTGEKPCYESRIDFDNMLYEITNDVDHEIHDYLEDSPNDPTQEEHQEYSDICDKLYEQSLRRDIPEDECVYLKFRPSNPLCICENHCCSNCSYALHKEIIRLRAPRLGIQTGSYFDTKADKGVLQLVIKYMYTGVILQSDYELQSKGREKVFINELLTCCIQFELHILYQSLQDKFVINDTGSEDFCALVELLELLE